MNQIEVTQLTDPLTSSYAYCDSREEEIIARIMGQYAQKRGERFLRENERLKQDPGAAVPQDVRRRMLEAIDKAFEEKQSE